MKWVTEALDLLSSAGTEGKDRLADLARRIEERLGRVNAPEETSDLLAAGSLLLQAGAVRGELTLAERPTAAGIAPEGGEGTRIRVLGIGQGGHDLMGALVADGVPGFHPGRYLLDVETSKARTLDQDVTCVVLESFPDTAVEGVPRYGDLLRAAYRSSGGDAGLPALLAATDEETERLGLSIHVVVDIEEPFLRLVPDLLFDLRSALEWGRKGRLVLHLLSRLSPRVRGSVHDTLLELERTRPFDDAFVLLSHLEPDLRMVARFMALSVRAPEILLSTEDIRCRGRFASYGISLLPESMDEAAGPEFQSRLETALRSAAPNWVPANAVLAEMAPERFFYIHPPDRPCPEEGWRLCPEMVSVPLSGVEPTLCRVQRGLRLEDVRLV